MGLEVQLLLIIMNNLTLHDLKTANKNTLEEVYVLNQDLIPMLGSLDSSNELKTLIDESSNSFYIEKLSIYFLIINKPGYNLPP